MDTLRHPEPANAFRKPLTGHGSVRRAILFGSQAAGASSAHSDLDLAVLTSAPLARHRLDAADFLPRPNHIPAEQRRAWIDH